MNFDIEKADNGFILSSEKGRKIFTEHEDLLRQICFELEINNRTGQTIEKKYRVTLYGKQMRTVKMPGFEQSGTYERNAIHVIRVIREKMGWDLRPTKDLVDKATDTGFAVLYEGNDKFLANNLFCAIRDIEGTVNIEEI